MLTTVSPATQDAVRRPLRIAHRGMPRAIRENAIASFALAIESGADGIELDVHATRDGEVVVHHHDTLSTGVPIAGLTRRDLRSAPLPYVVPTLREVCDLVAGRVELFVEIKAGGIEQEVLTALAAYQGALAIHSFDHAMIRRLASAGSTRRLGVLLEDAVADIGVLMRETRALDVWPHHALVSSELVQAVHELGGRVIPWTVNHAADVHRVSALQVDGICTDDVAALPWR